MRRSAWTVVLLSVIVLAVVAGVAILAAQRLNRPHNIILFVADGLRSESVNPEDAPAIAALRAEGVDLRNSHSIYPTLTMVNASALATGHRIGDTGNFGNTLYAGQPALPFPVLSPVVSVEDDEALGLLNQRFKSDYLNEMSLLALAHAQGWATAAVGKLGPTALQDLGALDGKGGIIIDDATGYTSSGFKGAPLAPELKAAIQAAGLDWPARDRGLNGSPGAYNMPGVWVPNSYQQDWMIEVTTKVVLPRLAKSGKPFALVYWSRDPDATQHYQGDSLNSLTPGINGKTSKAAIRNASNNLQALRDWLKANHLEDTTDIVVVSDHGFSTISRQSQTSQARLTEYRDVMPGFLPPNFLAMDLARALDLPLHELNGLEVDVANRFYPRGGGALLGADAKAPQVVVAQNGGSDLIYVPSRDPALTRRIVEFLEGQDYTGGLFVDDRLGEMPGTLPLSAIDLTGAALTPRPTIVVGFRSFLIPGCERGPELCAAEVADTPLQQGQGMHGTFSRADTHNFMAAVGPDFKRGFKDAAPTSNADVAPTLAHIMGLTLPSKGNLKGRVIEEALRDGAPVGHRVGVRRSSPGVNGFTTVLNWQSAGANRYFDAAGMPGRIVGLNP